MDADNKKLPLQNMADRHYALTHAKGKALYEAACVCLNRHHVSPVRFSISNAGSSFDTLVEWTMPDERTLGAYANTIDTTEEGAYACAIAAVELARGLFAVRRAETGTGADYYLGYKGQGIDDLEASLRLEVSGTDADSSVTVNGRLREKIIQAKKGKSNLPAMAGVVGFKVRIVLLEDVT